jgi:hypothetical protein
MTGLPQWLQKFICPFYWTGDGFREATNGLITMQCDWHGKPGRVKRGLLSQTWIKSVGRSFHGNDVCLAWLRFWNGTITNRVFRLQKAAIQFREFPAHHFRQLDGGRHGRAGALSLHIDLKCESFEPLSFQRIDLAVDHRVCQPLAQAFQGLWIVSCQIHQDIKLWQFSHGLFELVVLPRSGTMRMSSL